MPAPRIGGRDKAAAKSAAEGAAEPARPRSVESVGVAIVDSECRYIYVNSVLAGFHGCGILDHAGREVRACLPDEMAQVVLPLYEYVLTQQLPIRRLEFHARFDRGSIERWEASLWPVASGVCARVLQLGDARTSVGLEVFSAAEIEVLRMLSRGRSTKEMAAERGVSVETIATHRKRISRKIGAHSTAELVAAAASFVRELSIGELTRTAPAEAR